MLVIDLTRPIQDITPLIKESNQIKCDLVNLGTFGKASIRTIIEEVLKSCGLDDFVDDTTASILEMAFNGIKANYTYLCALEIIRKQMQKEHGQISKDFIFKDRVLKKTYLGLTQNKVVLNNVKEIIAKEGKIIQIKTKAQKEKRPLTTEEKLKIIELLEAANRIKSENINITLRIAKLPNKVIFDIINDAPITPAGLARIKEKRESFRKYYKEDRIAEFYMENLDETESAGFGTAMIDLRLLEQGYDPDQAFTVVNLNNKTCSTISLTF